MNIKIKDIDTISYALCCANTLLDMNIEELEKKGLNNVADKYNSEKEKIVKAMDSLQKIRKELHLQDDYAYDEKFGR